jgi:hypothetical protein
MSWSSILEAMEYWTGIDASRRDERTVTGFPNFLPTLTAGNWADRETQLNNKDRKLTSRRELITDCDCLVCGICGRPVMGFLFEVHAFCCTGGCLCAPSVDVQMSVSATPSLQVGKERCGIRHNARKLQQNKAN